MLAVQAGDPQGRIGELVRQQSEVREDPGPSPLGGLEIEELDLERVARLGALDEDRPADLVNAREVDEGHVLDGRILADLAVRRLEGVELDDGSARDRCERWDRAVPGEVPLVLRDVNGGGHHLLRPQSRIGRGS
jgi:hypothetical protein